MTLKNNRAPLQLIDWFFIWGIQRSMAYQAGLLEEHIQHTGSNATSSFVHHLVAICEFKLDLQSGNAQFGSKATIFFSCVTLQFDVWPWKTIRHLFYVASSFVNNFITTGEFKLELQSGNAQCESNSMIFLAVWPWNLTDDLEKQ